VNLRNSYISVILAKNLGVVVLLLVSAVAAFATLGDGKTKSTATNKSLLSSRSYNQGVFSLKSGYHFRGDKVIRPEQPQYININTTVTMRKGNVTYIVPLKKSVLFNKVKFNF
jgi:nitrate/TMAO reductase-like tetraheme cytochrome c subunit